ncbi:MAG TPA: hypothetical protein VFS00_16545, partial [Polyangiaceae bacterium]|nr:hypothetical protein [Polyangiaceae bacterium]
TVGGQDMVLVDTRREPITASGVRTLADHSAPPSPSPRPAPLSPRARVAPTMPDAAAFAIIRSGEDSVRRLDGLQHIGGVADKALALGRTEEGERILSARLLSILEATRATPGEVPHEVVDQAARFAVRLADVTAKGAWVDYLLDLYEAQARPLPAPLVEELYGVLRKVDDIKLDRLREHLDRLRPE